MGINHLRSLTVGSSTTSSLGGQGSSVESQLKFNNNYTPCVSMLVPGGKKSSKKSSFKCVILISKHMQVDGQIGDRAPRIKKKV